MYYALLAPIRTLFEDLSFDQFYQDASCLKFGLRNCFAVKYEKSMSLQDVREKILAQWKNEITTRPFAWEKDHQEQTITEHELLLKEHCVHAFIILEETGQAYSRIRKASRSNALNPINDYATALVTTGQDSLLQKLRVYSSYVTFVAACSDFVQMLTDGEKVWAQHPHALLQQASRRVGNPDKMLYQRLVKEALALTTPS
jgi:hypothetical protein